MKRSLKTSRAVERVFRSVQSETLENGLTILLCEDPHEADMAIGFCVKVGYFDEAESAEGISHLVEHMFLRATRGAVAVTRPSAAWELTGSTIYNHTLYAARIAPSEMEFAFRALAHAYCSPTVSNDTFATDKLVVLHEANQKAESSHATLVEQLYAEMFPTHRLGKWRIGTESSIGGISAMAAETFWRRHYEPARTVISVCGRFDRDRVLTLISRLG